MSLLAGSWKTTLVGMLEALFLFMIEESRNGGTLPQDKAGWLLWISGAFRAISGTLQKDHDKTNAPEPVAVQPAVSTPHA